MKKEKILLKSGKPKLTSQQKYICDYILEELERCPEGIEGITGYGIQEWFEQALSAYKGGAR
jgi:hypothetical protein